MDINQAILDISTASKQIQKLSTWKGSKDPFGHINNKLDKDYIYEFFCYTELLIDFQHVYDLEFIKGNKEFPKKPANKAGRPRFNLLDKKTKSVAYQLCTGTQISASAGRKIAPDISIQTPKSKNNPTEDDVIMVLDAKYSIKPQKRISIDTICVFSTIINDLKVANASKEAIMFGKKYNLWKGNCLITNALSHKKNIKYAHNMNIIQIEKFCHLKNFSAK